MKTQRPSPTRLRLQFSDRNISKNWSNSFKRSVFKALNGRRLWTPAEKELIASELARGRTRRRIHNVNLKSAQSFCYRLTRMRQDHFPELCDMTWKHQCQEIDAAQRKLQEGNSSSGKMSTVDLSSEECMDLIRFELTAGMSVAEIHKIGIRVFQTMPLKSNRKLTFNRRISVDLPFSQFSNNVTRYATRTTPKANKVT